MPVKKPQLEGDVYHPSDEIFQFSRNTYQALCFFIFGVLPITLFLQLPANVTAFGIGIVVVGILIGIFFLTIWSGHKKTMKKLGESTVVFGQDVIQLVRGDEFVKMRWEDISKIVKRVDSDGLVKEIVLTAEKIKMRIWGFENIDALAFRIEGKLRNTVMVEEKRQSVLTFRNKPVFFAYMILVMIFYWVLTKKGGMPDLMPFLQHLSPEKRRDVVMWSFATGVFIPSWLNKMKNLKRQVEAGLRPKKDYEKDKTILIFGIVVCAVQILIAIYSK